MPQAKWTQPKFQKIRSTTGTNSDAGYYNPKVQVVSFISRDGQTHCADGFRRFLPQPGKGLLLAVCPKSIVRRFVAFILALIQS
jgi:hypothetical protein